MAARDAQELYDALLKRVDTEREARFWRPVPALRPIVDALRATVELHKPERSHVSVAVNGKSEPAGWLVCHGCDHAGYDWEYPDWPCSTIEVIAEQLGEPTDAP